MSNARPHSQALYTLQQPELADLFCVLHSAVVPERSASWAMWTASTRASTLCSLPHSWERALHTSAHQLRCAHDCQVRTAAAFLSQCFSRTMPSTTQQAGVDLMHGPHGRITTVRRSLREVCGMQTLKLIQHRGAPLTCRL